ncbi:methylation-associated defense system AAA family ATPase MAD3 [Burkholderia ambifaria]|uniref:methylation-associated defense system AAA family ATPase MAD3 n=1 Tax=Burkholderia ambifaria TaxID=152480 RepID=UPI000F814B0A|nr:AAA family ATPase [Burkholderia ambifaria]
MITRLEATRYRCFEQLGIDMSEFQIIVGANGSGKTTLIDMPSLLGELLRADNIASVFTLKRGNMPARASALRELIFAGRGDDFSLAVEAKLPQEVQEKIVASLIERHDPPAHGGRKKLMDIVAYRNSPERWPTHIRYELRFEVFNERALNVKNEYLFVFPKGSSPEREIGGLQGEVNAGRSDWHYILRREYGGAAEFQTEVDPIQGSSVREEQVRTKPNLLAMSLVKYRADVYPSANWLYELLTEKTVFLEPDWEQLRAASAPGQPPDLIRSAINLPWLALSLKRQGLNEDLPDEEKEHYRSHGFRDWVDHVKTALPQVQDVDVKERKEDHHAYFSVQYNGDFHVTSTGLSDGTLRILMLTLLPYLPNAPRLIVTEEPENGIHPRAIEAVLQSLSSMYDSQVWVSSHSPVVLARAKLDQLLCARLASEGGVEMVAGTSHPRLQEWRGGIDLGSLFAAGVLG